MNENESDKIIGMLEERIKFHEETIKTLKAYGKMHQNDILISEGQIMEDRYLIEAIFNMTTNQ